jgi:anti-anti-sigma factor
MIDDKRDRSSGGTVMDFNFESRGNIHILRLQGELSAGTAEEFGGRVLALIDCGARNLVIDCSELNSISSTGLRALLQAHRRMTLLNGKIVLHSVSEIVWQLLETAGFTMVFRIYHSEQEALLGLQVTGMLPALY